MDSVSLTIGLALVATLVLSFLYLQIKRNREEARLLEDFLQLTRQRMLNISQHDLWEPGFAIGIDEEQKKIFFAKTREAVVQGIVIDLQAVETCKLHNKIEEINGNKIIDQIELRFSYRSNVRQPESVLTFYTKEENLNLNQELQLALKWVAIAGCNLQQVKPDNASQGVHNNDFAMA